MAIVEGCSYTYTTALVGRYGLQHAMRMSGGDKYSCNLKRHCFRAYCELVGLGLYEETERALEAGLADSFPMMSLIYRHTIPFINGEITQTESTRLVVNEWVRAITETNKKFELIERLISIP